MKIKIKIIIFFILILKSQFVLAEKVINTNHFNEKFYVSLPEKFCDVTTEYIGTFFKQILDKTRKKNPILPVAKIISAPCDRTENFDGYPWGWFGINKAGKYFTNQKQYNAAIAKLLDNQDALDAISKWGNKNSSKMFRDFGIKGKFDKLEKPKILWADKDSVTYMLINSGSVNNVKIDEYVVMSSTYSNGFILTTYVYTLNNLKLSLKEIISSVINNSAKIRDLNQ